MRTLERARAKKRVHLCELNEFGTRFYVRMSLHCTSADKLNTGFYQMKVDKDRRGRGGGGGGGVHLMPWASALCQSYQFDGNLIQWEMKRVFPVINNYSPPSRLGSPGMVQLLSSGPTSVCSLPGFLLQWSASEDLVVSFLFLSYAARSSSTRSSNTPLHEPNGFKHLVLLIHSRIPYIV